jgi:N-acetylglutamate synthase-like GNAT family acetyltransferase
MNNIKYYVLTQEDINLGLFSNFDRYQEVTKCWRKENNKWLLKDISFTEKWDQDNYKSLVKELKIIVDTGGTVFGVFEDDVLIGFASLENEFFGSNKQYLQLSAMHVSNNYRGNGIGKKLFELISKKAKEMGAKKLYISAHSSKETVAFYKSIGCKEAVEYNKKLVEKEPYDCQLEYIL